MRQARQSRGGKHDGRRARGARRGRAFTLLEILVVLAVIAILTGVLVPEFGGTFNSIQISSAAGQLGDMMAYCYNAAPTELVEHRLNIDPELGRAWVTREATLETGERVYEAVPLQNYKLPDSLQFDPTAIEEYLNANDDGTFYMLFRRDGMADFGQLRLISIQGLPMEIRLNGLTGRVTIHEITVETLEAEVTGETTE